MKYLACGTLALCLVILNLIPALAWNGFGHMLVAHIAYKKLKPAVRHRVNELLKLNPYYQKWASESALAPTKEEQEERIFLFASTWPDLIRTDNQYIDDGNRPKEPEATQNLGFSDHLLHKYWHYRATPFSEDGSTLPPLQSPNAETQIEKFSAVLSSKASDDLKAYDLTWLLHLVGDIHQPLHCITRVSKESPEGDNEAGKVLIKYPGFEDLHWFWDCALGSDGVEKVALFADALAPANKSQAFDLKVANWIKDGFDLAVSKVYASPVNRGNGPFTIDEAYKEKATAIAKQRVVLAGERLAKLLNQRLK